MRTFIATMVMWIAGACAAHAQSLYFPAESYGQANKSFTESSLNQAQLEVLMGKQDVFEPINDLEELDPFRRLGRAVGMLDLLVRLPNGELRNATCTATLIAANRVITNYHCIPGMDHKVERGLLRLGFLDRVNAPGRVYNISLTPIDRNAVLDYAIIAVEGVDTKLFPPLSIKTVAARARQSLYMIHYPMGQPQRLTRLRCQAGQPALTEHGDLLHHCDTLGGSSGALVFALDGGQVVAIHKSGVPDAVRPFNLATPSGKLLELSYELQRIIGSETQVVAVAPAPAPTPVIAVSTPAQPVAPPPISAAGQANKQAMTGRWKFVSGGCKSGLSSFTGYRIYPENDGALLIVYDDGTDLRDQGFDVGRYDRFESNAARSSDNVGNYFQLKGSELVEYSAIMRGADIIRYDEWCHLRRVQ